MQVFIWYFLESLNILVIILRPVITPEARMEWPWDSEWNHVLLKGAHALWVDNNKAWSVLIEVVRHGQDHTIVFFIAVWVGNEIWFIRQIICLSPFCDYFLLASIVLYQIEAIIFIDSLLAKDFNKISEAVFF